MDARNRELVLESLGETHSVTAEVSTGPQSMAAYTSRLLEHLINKAKASIPVPPPQPQPQPQPQPLATPGNAVFLPDASPGVFDPQWTAMDGLGVGGGGHAWGGNGNDHDVLFANILRPLHNLGEDLVYPTQDDQLWCVLIAVSKLRISPQLRRLTQLSASTGNPSSLCSAVDDQKNV